MVCNDLSARDCHLVFMCIHFQHTVKFFWNHHALRVTLPMINMKCVQCVIGEICTFNTRRVENTIECTPNPVCEHSTTNSQLAQAGVSRKPSGKINSNLVIQIASIDFKYLHRRAVLQNACKCTPYIGGNRMTATKFEQSECAHAGQKIDQCSCSLVFNICKMQFLERACRI